MAYLDRTDLIRRLKVRLNRPATDAAFTVTSTDDAYDDALTEAQDELTKLIATYIPDVMTLAPTSLTSSDGGYLYTFGADADTANKFALGFFSVFATRADIPDNPLVPNVDFLIEGTRLRILPVNTPRTFSDSGPYAMYVPASNVISSSSAPTIPVICRMALLEKAGEFACRRLGLDSSEFKDGFAEAWAAVLASVRTQAQGKYGAPLSRRPRAARYRR